MELLTQEYADKVASWSSTDAWLAEAKAFVRSCPQLPRPSGRVLDVGCGTGRMRSVISYLSSWRYYGIEVNPAYVLNGTPYVDLYDGQTIPYPDGSFDMAIAFHVIGHTQNPIGAVHEMVRVTKRGGWVGLCVPNAQFDRWEAVGNWWRGYRSDSTIKYPFDPESIEWLMTTSRLEGLTVTSWGRRACRIGPRLRLFAWARKI